MLGHLAAEGIGDAMLESKLARQLLTLTIVKIVGLLVIYILFFAPFHRSPTDASDHIAGSIFVYIDSDR